jgi:hypothetical protein
VSHVTLHAIWRRAPRVSSTQASQTREPRHVARSFPAPKRSRAAGDYQTAIAHHFLHYYRTTPVATAPPHLLLLAVHAPPIATSRRPLPFHRRIPPSSPRGLVATSALLPGSRVSSLISFPFLDSKVSIRLFSQSVCVFSISLCSF